MTKTDFVKTAIAFVVGAGTNKIVKAIIKNNISPEKVTDKVAIECAAFVLSGIAASACKKYTDEMIDDMIAKWQEMKSKIKEAKESN